VLLFCKHRKFFIMEVSDEAPVPVKKKPVSMTFLMAVILLGVGAYFAGPHVMTYVMLWQEGAKARGPAIESQMPEGRPTLPTAS
jgi:hypothetical protein